MAEALSATVPFGADHVLLGAELLQALTSGDAACLQELLSGEGRPHAGAGGHTAINVNAGAVVPPPGPVVGASTGLLGVTSNGNTALHLAASRGHAELAALVCERAPSLAATRNRSLDTPLHCAAKAGHREVVASLLSAMRAGGDEAAALVARNCLGATALFEAVRHGHTGVVETLMSEAPELTSLTTDNGLSPLYLAASVESSLEMVRALLRPSPDGTPSPASFSGPAGRTALHVAAARSKEMSEEILNWTPQGPNLLTAVDSSGRTPLQFAVLYKRHDVVELFLDGHTSVEQARIPDNHGLYPVHTAAMVGTTQIIDVLIKKCPDYCEMVDERGRNFLHCAVEHDQESVVRYICENDTFAMLLNATDHEGNTALHLAVKHGLPRIVNLLLQTMAVEIGVTNRDGLTAGDLGRHALPPGRLYYFLNPHFRVVRSLQWSRANVTLDASHPLYVDNKPTNSFLKDNEPTEEQTSDGDDLTKTGTIAAVLIATVAFAAAFTVPGGFVADDHPGAGTAILARRFAFRAFVVSDTMAFLCSILATCFFVYGGAREVPRKHRFRSNILGDWLMPLEAQFMMATFVFGFQLVLGGANRWLILFVYTVSLPSVLFCFPDFWIVWDLGLWRAIWRRAGWRGLVNIQECPSSPIQLLRLLARSHCFQSHGRALFAVLISATFIIAIVLNIALPNY
ncbi:unnamed protein product [Urochloa humidicola]